MDIKIIEQNLEKYSQEVIKIEGWIRNHRDQKEFGFIEMFDGTTFGSIQVVYDKELSNFDEIVKFRVGSAIEVEGNIVLTPDAKQAYEIKASKVILLGDSPEDYPIQAKRHSREFLREVGHLRSRTLLFNSVFRVRSVLSFAIHSFFVQEGFVHCPSPILTKNDGEGAGETFGVSTLDYLDNKTFVDGKIDYANDFFAGKTNLSVTGQLEAEIFALSFKKTYTFGPTFRAEKSNTKTHASEFWMIEPEMAFTDVHGIMENSEKMLKYVISYVLEHCSKEIAFFDEFVEKGLLDKLNNLVNDEFKRVEYTQAIDILLNSGVEFENKVAWGEDLATEHEKYLTDVHFKSPVFVINWPKDIKAFYMKINDDNKTVAGMDLLVPRVGELIGGSQREERYDVLKQKMLDQNMTIDELEWYLDLRKYGGCVHSGYGVGFERLIMYVTGIENIRDAHPFPRTPRNCEF